MPRDYRAALAALAAGNGAIRYPDDRPISSGGEGFVTAEVESGSGRVMMGELGAFLKLDRVDNPERAPAGARRATTTSSCETLAGERARASRARAAWSAACRSATTAARSTT